MDEQELLKIQIQSYEFYAGLIERAVGGGASAKLPRWDEQRALEYRALADQLRQQLAQLQSQAPVVPTSQPADAAGAADSPAPDEPTTTTPAAARP